VSLRWLWALAWLCAGCQRAAPAADQAPSAAVVSAAPAAAKKTATPEEEARFQGKTLEEMPLLLGPLPAGKASAEREQRLQELLSGQTPAERLPLHDTNAAPYDAELYLKLTSEPDAPARQGRVTPRGLSGVP
jgi:hypothetical protein